MCACKLIGVQLTSCWFKVCILKNLSIPTVTFFFAFPLCGNGNGAINCTTGGSVLRIRCFFSTFFQRYSSYTFVKPYVACRGYYCCCRVVGWLPIVAFSHLGFEICIHKYRNYLGVLATTIYKYRRIFFTQLYIYIIYKYVCILYISIL